MKTTLAEIKRGDRFAVPGIRGSMIAADDAKPVWKSGVVVSSVLGIRSYDAMPIEARSDTKVTVLS
jgi:hypothetical protein